MKRVIWKFPLVVTDRQVVTMPEGSAILTAQMQNGELCLWAIVTVVPMAKREDRVFEIFGTGNPLPVDKGVERCYVETVQDGPLVWHLFERVPEMESYVSTT